LEIKRGDHAAFRHFPVDHKRTIAIPSTRALGLLSVDFLFPSDEYVRKQAIGIGPRADDFIGRRIAEHFFDRRKKMLAHDGVMLRLDIQRAMLLRNQLHCRGQGTEIVDVRSVGAYRACERFLLASGVLMGLVEEYLDLRVALKHAL